ncbi:hypothetical protein BDM02DRAFT_85235 [Thelephora ganbajun]|uniref:Uncharacterized protein n=1 Tax=Thelephora ganbajun TaxID=370292 RepID=A0ACB6ZXI6_THEGA|nr:hypothetical protein BDM02DRAFT_85235 [Thelephora ganbajun]
MSRKRQMHKTLARPTRPTTRNMSLFSQPKSQSAIATTPGDLLLRLNDTCHAGVFSSFVLRRYLCPALDALPADQRANLFAILQEAERATVDVSSHFGRLDLGGEDSDDDCDGSSDDGGAVDPAKAMNMQLTERKRRIEALIAANTNEVGSTSDFEEEALSWLPILWHLGVEGATNTGEVLVALQLCDTISPRCSSSLNCSITSIKKSSVYSNTGSVSEHVGWIRRELLLKKASSGDISRVLPILSELQSDDLRRIVKWLPGSTGVDGKSLSKFPHSSCNAIGNLNLHL